MLSSTLWWVAVVAISLLIVWWIVGYVLTSVVQRALFKLQTHMSPMSWHTHAECVAMAGNEFTAHIALRLLYDAKKLQVRVSDESDSHDLSDRMLRIVERNIERGYLMFVGMEALEYRSVPGGGRRKLRATRSFVFGALVPQPVRAYRYTRK